MRFKEFLKEMAAKAGDVSANAKANADNHHEEWESAPIVYEKGPLKIRKFRQMYSMWNNDELIFSAKVKEDDDVFTIDDLYTPEAQRQKGNLSKFINILLDDLGAVNIVLGNRHSDSTIKMLKANGLSSLKKSWVNMRTGKVVKHDSNDFEKYYQDEAIAGLWKLYLHR